MPKIWQLLVWLSLADFFCQHCHQNMATACLAGPQSNNAAILHAGHLRMSAAYKQPATPTSNWINQLFDHGEAASDLSILACDQQFWRSGHLMRGEGGPWQLEISLVWGIHVYILEHKTCDILAAERLRLMRFDNRLIIDSFQEAVCLLKW